MNTEKLKTHYKYNDYNFSLDNFTGPLDLLLHLVNKDKIDIVQINLSKLTFQYLSFLEEIRKQNINIASEFLSMAAVLLKLKSKALLPKNDAVIEEDEIDSQEKLILRLTEYKKIKKIALGLKRVFDRTQKNYEINIPINKKKFKPETSLDDLSLFDFLKIYDTIKEKSKRRIISHNVELEPVNLEEQIRILYTKIEKNKCFLSFRELILQSSNRLEVVILFLAVLELTKRQKIVIQQVNNYEDIYLKNKNHC